MAINWTESLGNYNVFFQLINYLHFMKLMVNFLTSVNYTQPNLMQKKSCSPMLIFLFRLCLCHFIFRVELLKMLSHFLPFPRSPLIIVDRYKSNKWMWFFIFTPTHFSKLDWGLTALTTFTFHLLLGYHFEKQNNAIRNQMMNRNTGLVKSYFTWLQMQLYNAVRRSGTYIVKASITITVNTQIKSIS